MNVQINSAEVLERYGNLVYQLALARTKNPVDAEDIFQEVFLRLVRKNHNIESDEHLKAWLIRVTINCSHSFWRSDWKQRTVPIEQEFSAEECSECTDVYEHVLALPNKYRTVIHLFYYEDMPIEKISQTLNIGYNATAKRLSRARNLLKQQMIGGLEDDEFSIKLQSKRESPQNP